jgi:hypothetical protein
MDSQPEHKQTSSQFHTLATVTPAPTEQKAWWPNQSSCHAMNQTTFPSSSSL